MLDVLSEKNIGNCHLLSRYILVFQVLFYKSLVGSTQSVLFEQCKNKIWSGLTDNYVRVHTQSEQTLTNKFLNINLEHIKNDELFGTLRASNKKEL